MIRCQDCRRKFGGSFGYKLGHPVTLDRCRSDEELRARGMHRNRRGVWVRRRPSFQGQLDFRAGSRVRRWFGKPWRALSPQERREYRVKLGWQKTPDPSSGSQDAGDRNAQAVSG